MIEKSLDYESLWNRIADRAMKRRKLAQETKPEPMTAWERIKPHLAQRWCTMEELMGIAAVSSTSIHATIRVHGGVKKRKTAGSKRLEYRLK